MVAFTLPLRATSTAIATPTQWGSTWAGRCSLSPRETSEKVRSGIKRNFSLQLLHLPCFSGEEVTDNYCAVFSELGVLARKQFLRVRNRFGFLEMKLSIYRRTSFSLVSAKLARRSGRRTASCRPARPLRRCRQEREKEREKIERQIERQKREKVIEEMERQRCGHCETLRWRTSCASTRWTTWPPWREERSTRRSPSIAKRSLSSR